VLINQVVNVPGQVAPGSTATFQVPVNPCQPVLMDRAWVRITLSSEPISDMNDDGRGPGHCFAEGETEDYLYDPTLEYGDAPDSTNNDGQQMTAYTLANGSTVTANFPTTFKTTSGLPGPCHIQQLNVTAILVVRSLSRTPMPIAGQIPIPCSTSCRLPTTRTMTAPTTAWSCQTIGRMAHR